MPDYFGIEGWFSLLNNISISYIAALIFFVLQVYKPECENHKKAQMALNPLFLDLVRFIELTIACCKKYVHVDEKMKITIDWMNKKQKIIYFVPVIDGQNNCGQQSVVRKSELELRGMGKIYKSKIKEIKERIDFRECAPDILYALSKLEAMDFFQSTLVPALMFDGSIVGFPGFQDSVSEFEMLKDEFKKCCGITCKYEVGDAENREIALYEAVYFKEAWQAESVNEFNEIAYKEYLRVQLRAVIGDEKQVDAIIDSILQVQKEQ